MKKLTSSTDWYGPFSEIVTTDDAYVGDGVVFPFTVVGTGCVISDYDPAVDVHPVQDVAPPPAAPTKEELLAELAALTAKIQALE